MLAMKGVIAANRFGLGARPGEVAAIAGDPRGWVRAQVVAQPALPSAYAGLLPASDFSRRFQEARARGGDGAAEQEVRRQLREHAVDEAGARLEAAIASDQPLVERLTDFWFNHFTVSSQRPAVAPMCSGFEREAIRPHIFGRFADMLVAVARHPAMLFYLDNAVSIGPRSPAGALTQGRRGLNENYARELLELHTVGVDGGYGQEDVRELARVLTGWSLGRPAAAAGQPRFVMGDDGTPGAFHFHAVAHEPGAKTVLGRTFNEDGEAEGLAALHFLAAHPATAKRVATRLVRHFVADDPPPRLVARIAQVFAASGGDLRAVTLALIDAPEAWAAPQAKVRTPQDFIVAGLRAGGQALPPRLRLFFMARELGQPVYGAPSPAGWADLAKEWVAPEAMLRRIDLARAWGRALAPHVDPVELAAYALGEGADPQTHRAIAGAPSRADGVALVFASAEFQRR